MVQDKTGESGTRIVKANEARKIVSQLAELPLLVTGSRKEVFQQVRRLQEEARELLSGQGGDVVSCSQCDGEGLIALTGIFAETVTLLRQEQTAINGADLARKHGVNPTAMNNRLVWLEARGLAQRQRYGRESRWLAITHKAN